MVLFHSEGKEKDYTELRLLFFVSSGHKNRLPYPALASGLSPSGVYLPILRRWDPSVDTALHDQ